MNYFQASVPAARVPVAEVLQLNCTTRFDLSGRLNLIIAQEAPVGAKLSYFIT